jgi:flagellin
MSLRINTNVAALNAYNNLNNNQAMQSQAIEELSSGLRINTAADDASGLSISQGLNSQINGLTQAVSNTNDGIDVAQIADGALATEQTILQRMRSLVVQAGNTGTGDSASQNAISSEVKALNSELDNVSKQTKYGQKNLLDGTYDGTFQVGANGGDTIELKISAVTGTSGFVTGSTSSTYGLNSSGLATSGLAITGTFTSGTLYTNANASGDLKTIDAAIAVVSAVRSGIGATQNQLSYTATNLQTGITNVTASRSNLTDADLATEVSAMTQAQILTSAATSVLAQANSMPQAILKLLQ